MSATNFIKQGLYLQNLPFDETDIQHIHNTLFTINEAEVSLKAFPNLNKEVPVTIVDKRLILWEN